MPQCCAVPMCSRRGGGHRFPKDKERMKQWIIAIRRDFTPSKNSIVCKQHFTKDDFELPKDSVLDNPRPVLKKDAVPSQFIWNEPTNLLYNLKMSQRSSRKKFISDENMMDVDIPTESKQPAAENDDSGSDEQPVAVKTELADDACTTGPPDPLEPATGHIETPHVSPTNNTYVQPSTSTQIEVKLEFEEEDVDYKEMYFKSREEVITLKTQVQNLIADNRIFCDRNQRHTAKIGSLLEKNNNLIEEIEGHRKTQLRLTEKIRLLTEKKQHYAERIRDDVKICKNKDIVEENSSDLEKIKDLTVKLQRLIEENESLSELRQRLVDKNENLSNTVQKVDEENRALKMKVKVLLRRHERLRINCRNTIGVKTKEINVLLLCIYRLRRLVGRRPMKGNLF